MRKLKKPFKEQSKENQINKSKKLVYGVSDVLNLRLKDFILLRYSNENCCLLKWNSVPTSKQNQQFLKSWRILKIICSINIWRSCGWNLFGEAATGGKQSGTENFKIESICMHVEFVSSIRMNKKT